MHHRKRKPTVKLITQQTDGAALANIQPDSELEWMTTANFTLNQGNQQGDTYELFVNSPYQPAGDATPAINPARGFNTMAKYYTEFLVTKATIKASFVLYPKPAPPLPTKPVALVMKLRTDGLYHDPNLQSAICTPHTKYEIFNPNMHGAKTIEMSMTYYPETMFGPQANPKVADWRLYGGTNDSSPVKHATCTLQLRTMDDGAMVLSVVS